MAPVDRLLRADRPSQTVPPAACPHQRTPVAPSWPPRIIAVTSEIRTGQRQELFFEAPFILVLLGALSLLRASIARWTTEIAVTNRRVILKHGLIRRDTIEINMPQVESVDFR